MVRKNILGDRKKIADVKIPKFFILTIIISVLILSTSIISAYSSYVGSAPAYTFQYQAAPYTGGQLLPTFNREMCGAGQDFIVQVDPTGCTDRKSVV